MKTAHNREDGFAHLIALGVVALLVVASISSVSVSPEKSTPTSQVLSEEIEEDDSELESEEREAEEKVEQERDNTKSNDTSVAERELKRQITEEEKLRKQKELEKKRREIQIEKEKLRVEAKERSQKLKLNKEGMKVKLEMEDGRVKLNAQEEGKVEVELEERSITEVQKGLRLMDLEVATRSGEKFVLRRGNGAAVTGLPISIELSTNTLIVTTPKGEKRVAVLPDAAIQNLIRDRLIDEVEEGATESAEIELKEDGDKVVYEIQGVQRKKLLGLWTVTLQKKVKVSAETGEVVSTELSTLDRIKELLSN